MDVFFCRGVKTWEPAMRLCQRGTGDFKCCVLLLSSRGRVCAALLRLSGAVTNATRGLHCTTCFIGAPAPSQSSHALRRYLSGSMQSRANIRCMHWVAVLCAYSFALLRRKMTGVSCSLMRWLVRGSLKDRCMCSRIACSSYIVPAVVMTGFLNSASVMGQTRSSGACRSTASAARPSQRYIISRNYRSTNTMAS